VILLVCLAELVLFVGEFVAALRRLKP